MSSPERWQRLKEIYAAALERAPAERAAFIEAACPDPSLRAEVLSLIAWHEGEAGLPSHPPATLTQDRSAPTPVLGQRIGAYRTLREIGRGGMGIVYLAERADGAFERRVALKLIQAGVDREGLLRRFRTERQILAGLDHPGIARLLDGGSTEDGRPYLVMEHIEGAPIDAFCDGRRLTVAERLELFRSVCAAVHFAHQHLVVHRDIKPRNILVTPDGRAHLLDFGIAKVLSPDPGWSLDLTGTGDLLLTPEYASPEQVRGEPITTASDVYTLGVLLYELLTGRRPYRARSPLELVRAICEETPERPSTAVTRIEERTGPGGDTVRVTPEEVSRTREGHPERLRKRLRGDLDNIVLRAMRKEPQRRYSSAEQLGEDLRRHLVGLPVLARGDALSYRASKFVLRHKGGLAAALLVLLSLVFGLLAVSLKAREAERERDLAVRAANAMVNELAAGLERMVGPTESRLALLRQAAAVFDEAAGGRASAPELRRQWVNASAVLSKAYRSLGELESARGRARDAEAGARALLRARDTGSREQALLASVLIERSDAEAALGKTEEARAAREEALALLEPMVGGGTAGPDERRVFVILLQRRADRLYEEGRLAEARGFYDRAHAIAKSLAEADPRNLAFAAVYATTVERLGDMHYYADKDTKGACGRYREALRARRSLAELSPNDPALLQGLSIAMQNVGWCAEDAGDWKEALPLYEESVGLQKRLLGADPHNTITIPNLMGGVATIANALLKRGDLQGAVERYREAVEVGERSRRERRATAAIDAKTANIRLLLADALVRMGRPSEAVREVEASEALLRDLKGSDPGNASYRELITAAASTRKAIAGRR